MNFLVMETDRSRKGDWTNEGCELLRSYGKVNTVHVKDGGETEALKQFSKFLPDADAVLIAPWFRPSTTPEYWHEATKMKVLAGTFDNRFSHWIDFSDLQSRGGQIIDTSRSMTPSVAEFALAMTLNLIRDIPASIELVRKGKWKPEPWQNPGFVFGDLTGRTVGLAGFGSINRRYAELIAPFHCTVNVYDPFVSDDILNQSGHHRANSLVELAQSSEIFVIGIPPTAATLEIINREVIDALPKGALLVLVTRMAVVEQEALWRRTQAGEIRAAVDVFAPEPPPEDASFRQDPNVLPSPHVAGDTHYCHRRCFNDACKDVIAVMTGGKPVFLANMYDHNLYEGKLK
jgi:phosphoglycerate dehydrogenase-like enzyme